MLDAKSRTMMSLGFCEYTTTGLIMLMLSSLDLAQPTKLRVPSPDSVLSRFGHHGLIRGTVTIEGVQTPLSGVLVSIRSQMPASPSSSDTAQSVCSSDSAGFYSLGMIPTGQVLLEATLSGYFSFAETFNLRDREQLTIDIAMVPDYSHPEMHTTGGIAIEISDASTGEPVGRAGVQILETNSHYLTDDAGCLQLHDLRPGEYHLTASSSGYRAAHIDSVNVRIGHNTFQPVQLIDSLLSADDLLCSERHKKDYPVTWIAPEGFGTITGEVYVRFAGEPLSDAYVYLAPYGDQTSTDSTGTFAFHGLRPGIYCLTVRVADLERKTKHGIRVDPGKTVNVDVPFSRPLWKIQDD